MKPIKRLRKLGRRLRALLMPRDAPPATVQRPLQPELDVDALQADYAASGLVDEPDSFMLCRIVGNDLPPRHARGSARANVRFILEHEPELPDCRKSWLLNRIVDPKEEAAIIALLERHRQSYRRIPFVLEDYARIGWDLDGFRQRGALLNLAMHDVDVAKPRYQLQVRVAKNNYVMNNNGARNAALESGRAAAKWVMPWDGNCFLTEAAWSELRAAVLARPYVKYFVVPMARIAANRALRNPTYRPPAADEPQILFRRDAELMFDPAYAYGMGPKVELLLRLGVPGPWDEWVIGREYRAAGDGAQGPRSFRFAGWVARLQSGRPHLELGARASVRRKRARDTAIVALLDRLDVRALSTRLQPGIPVLYGPEMLARLCDAGDRSRGDAWRDVAGRLAADAQAAMRRGLHAVTDKTSVAPSGDKHDYWHPAPYYWPNPDTVDGLPYVERDGVRRPDAVLYAPGSEQFDRSRLQRVLEDTAICALAWRATRREEFAAHGAALLRHWFLAPATRMNPHLRYAQVRLGHNNNQGVGPGLVELRDLPLLLDGARLLAEAGALDRRDEAEFRTWLAAYRDWMRDSPQGREALLKRNNIGTSYDLQAAAIAAYLQDAAALVEIFRRCRERIQIQFDPDGSQPRELKRRDSLHYCCFNLQAWIALARIAAACGEDLWSYRSAAGHSLRRGLAWLLAFDQARTWPHSQVEPFDWDRLAPLQAEHDRLQGRVATAPPPSWLQRFPAETGIPPYWFL